MSVVKSWRDDDNLTKNHKTPRTTKTAGGAGFGNGPDDAHPPPPAPVFPLSTSRQLLSSHTLPGGPAITSSTKPLPRATLVTDKEAFLSPIAGEGKVGSPVRAHVFWPASGDGGGQDGGGMAASVFSVTVWTGGEAVHWQDGGTMQVSR